jgi:uncharacterized protein (DUF983 family)
VRARAFCGYDYGMNEANSRPIGRTILAGVILLVAGWVLLKVVLGVVVWLATVAIVIAAVLAVIWAVRVLL